MRTMANTKLHAALTFVLLASACGGERLEFCDLAEGEVSFEVLAPALDLEGLWVHTEYTGTSRPLDLLFDASGRPREVHTAGWKEDGTSGSRHTFGCDDASHPVSFPLVAGGTNSLYGEGNFVSGSGARTLEEVVVDGTRITLTYREFNPNSDSTIYSWRWSFEYLESGDLALTLDMKYDDQGSWSEGNPIVMTRN